VTELAQIAAERNSTCRLAGLDDFRRHREGAERRVKLAANRSRTAASRCGLPRASACHPIEVCGKASAPMRRAGIARGYLRAGWPQPAMRELAAAAICIARQPRKCGEARFGCTLGSSANDRAATTLTGKVRAASPMCQDLRLPGMLHGRLVRRRCTARRCEGFEEVRPQVVAASRWRATYTSLVGIDSRARNARKPMPRPPRLRREGRWHLNMRRIKAMPGVVAVVRDGSFLRDCRARGAGDQKRAWCLC